LLIQNKVLSLRHNNKQIEIMTTFKIYSAKQQGSLSNGEIIAVQSLEVFEKYNGKWAVENYSTITSLYEKVN